MESGGSRAMGWSGTYLVGGDEVDEFVVAASHGYGSPSSERVAELIGDTANDVSICNSHGSSRFVLSLEWDRAAAEFNCVLVECFSGCVEADFPDFKVGSV